MSQLGDSRLGEAKLGTQELYGRTLAQAEKELITLAQAEID